MYSHIHTNSGAMRLQGNISYPICLKFLNKVNNFLFRNKKKLRKDLYFFAFVSMYLFIVETFRNILAYTLVRKYFS